MRILLVSVNRETEPFTAAPLGLALVASSLRRAGHEVRALDLLFAEDPEAALRDAVRDFRPSLVGVSIRNVESSTRFLLPDYREIIDLIKRETDAPVVLGGPGYSIMPGAALEYLGADFGIAGEGELSMPMLADALQGRTPYSSVPGLCRFEGGSYIQNAQSPLDLSCKAENPAWDLFPAEKYDMLGIQSKRGCSFSCIYCTYPGLEGVQMRLRPPEDVAREMESGAGLNAPFYFVDNIFNSPPAHAAAVCDAIIGRGIKASWGCLASPVGLDGRLLEKMKRAGCESVEVGADSLSDRSLLKLGKKFTKKEAMEAIRSVKDAGTLCLVFLLLGGPGEDIDSLMETFDALEEVEPHKVFAVAGVRIYPGTPLARLSVKEGIIPPGDSLMEPKFYVSDRLGERLYSLTEEYFSAHPDWVCYPAKGIITLPSPLCGRGKAKGQGEGAIWDTSALEVFEKVLSEVPALLRPIARKAVRKKAQESALRKTGTVNSMDVKDSFLSETPRPFQGPMKQALRRLGLLDG